MFVSKNLNCYEMANSRQISIVKMSTGAYGYGKNEESGILSRSKKLVVVVPLLPALIYGLITRSMGVDVGAGTSEAIRAIEAATSSDTKNSDDSKDDSDYADNTVWQAINNDH